MQHHKTGLVLSGGGAKGAYQAGVIMALAEAEVQIDAISGTSIGALNGAILSCSPSFKEGASRLKEIWETLAENPPLDGQEPTLLRFMEAMGLQIPPSLRRGAIVAKEIRDNLYGAICSPNSAHLVDNNPIKVVLKRYISPEQLAKGIPLWVSVFPRRSVFESVMGYSLAVLGIKDNPQSDFLHVQSLAPQEQEKALLASAAIPFLLEAQEINGELYCDGGLGGANEAQGNTPITPLLDFGCDTVIVTSLSDRNAWSKQKHPNAKVIGVERKYPINRSLLMPQMLDVLSFHPKSIYSWMDQGYGDTKRCMERKGHCIL